MNRKAPITIKTSKDGKRCLNSCRGLDDFGDHCNVFECGLGTVVIGETGDRFDAVRCRACVVATNRFDRLNESRLSGLGDNA